MASAETKADCEALMSALLPMAEKELSEHRVVLPFCSTLSSGNELGECEAGSEPGAEDPEARIAELRAQLCRLGQQGAIKACALAYSVSSASPAGGEPAHAVHILLDHRDDYSLVVTFPYHWSGSELVIDEPHAADGAHGIFGR